MRLSAASVFAVALTTVGACGGAEDSEVDDGQESKETSAQLEFRRPAPTRPTDALTYYEKKLPHTTQPRVTRRERRLLSEYLTRPTDVGLAKRLARVHLDHAQDRADCTAGEELKHSILAQYFLNRAKSMGATEIWIDEELQREEAYTKALLGRSEPIQSDEQHPAHLFWRETFHLNQEQNRYEALDKLLADFAEHPTNVYTAFALTAANLWIGGEAEYDDPTTLYNFALGGFFSLHTMQLAKSLELAWDKDPSSTARFRMAANLGGFSLLQRRWLAAAHHDTPALKAADDEHRAWHEIHPSFHSFTIGYSFFDDPSLFQEGKTKMEDATWHCEQTAVRTCTNLPRFSFVQLGFNLGYIDFLLKNGDLDIARQLLELRKTPAELENWAVWDIGRDSWLHREQNLEAISALYQNDDPSDDPVNFEMKRRKWGVNTTTCQECHQVQRKVWTPEQFAEIQLPPEEVASVRTWPEIMTTWYGMLPR